MTTKKLAKLCFYCYFLIDLAFAILLLYLYCYFLLFQFMDMGFTHEHARLALLNTGSLEEATDYILTHPPPPPSRVGTV